MDSIISALGSGSGVDTAALVSNLVQAQFAQKSKLLSQQSETLTAQISTVSSIKSALTGFSTALSSLATGGSLTATTSSSDASVATAEALPGATIGSLSSIVKVTRLAANQVANAAPVADRAASNGTGTLTITLGTAVVDGGGQMTGFTAGGGPPITVAIDLANSSLDQIAARINAANAGVTASIVSDAAGSRLTLRGVTGAAQGFTIGATEDGGAPGLNKFRVGPGITATQVTQAAASAAFTVDGIALTSSSNAVTGVIDGVRLNLVGMSDTRTTTIGATRPADGLKQAVSDYVVAYNELASMLAVATDAKTGSLRADTATRQLVLSLRALNSTQLNGSTALGAPRSLSEIGVKTNRDGTLSIDDAQLARSITNFSSVVEGMFAAGAGLPAALKSVVDGATSTTTGLGASAARYGRIQSQLATAQAKLDEDSARMSTRLTKQFAGMDARVSAYKATQSFLDQQIKAWTADR